MMIENAFERAAITTGAWWAIVPPGVAVTVVILACTMLGTALEDALNPRLRVEPPVGAALPRCAARRRRSEPS